MSGQHAHNGRIPTAPEGVFVLLALLYAATHLEGEQLQALAALADLGGFAAWLTGLDPRPPLDQGPPDPPADGP